MFNLALSYGRAKQWAQARSTADDLHRTLPNSAWTTRAFVQLGQLAETAKDDTDASYFYRAAVNFIRAIRKLPGAVLHRLGCSRSEKLRRSWTIAD